MKLDREEPRSESSILSSNFGGLNTTSSALNTPLDDATVLVNVDTNLDGSLSKRLGTVLLRDSYGLLNTSTSTVRSFSGYSYIVSKMGTDIRCYIVSNEVMYEMRRFPLIFRNESASERANFVQLPDTYSRILLLTGRTPPKEIFLVEQTHKITGTLTGTSFTIPFADKWKSHPTIPTALPFGIIVKSGDSTFTVYTYTTVIATYDVANNELDIVLPFAPQAELGATEHEITLIDPRQTTWVESISFFGDRFYDTLSRFNVTETDNSIQIPDKLRSDIDTVNNVYGTYPFILKPNSDPSTAYTFAGDQPTTTTNYGFSDGAVYVPGASNSLNTAPLYATFGLAKTPFPQPPETVYTVRLRELRFNGGIGASSDFMQVHVDDELVQPHLTTTTPAPNPRQYTLYTNTLTRILNGSTRAFYLGFNSSFPVGISPTSRITMSNGSGPIIGQNYEVETSLLNEGSYRRCYGLGYFADFQNHIYPSVGCVFQGRLVLSGFANDPSRVIISSSASNDERYTNFQITDDLSGLTTDPFDVTVSGNTDDRIMGVVEWNNSLFILTQQSVYRASGGDQPISATRKFVTYVSNIGLVNSNCLTRTDTAVYYLSDQGVFNLVPRVEDGEFTTIEKSLKIRNKFVSYNDTTAAMYYDAQRRKLYVAISREGLSTDGKLRASNIYVMDTVRDAWTQYDADGSFGILNFFLIRQIQDNEVNYVGAGALRGFIRFDYRYYVDYAIIRISGATSTPISGGFSNIPLTLVPSKQLYDIPPEVLHSGLNNVKDIYVHGIPQNSYTRRGNQFYLNNPVTLNTVVVVSAAVAVSPSYVSPLTAIVDDVLTPLTTHSYNTTTYQYEGTVATPNVNSILVTGNAYTSTYVSPLFTYRQLGTYKGVRHVYLFFRNDKRRLLNVSYEISDTFNQRANASIGVIFNSDSGDADYTMDIYGASDILWDSAYFDISESTLQQEEYTLFKEPIYGIGYGFRVVVFNNEGEYWQLVGYQVDVSRYGDNYYTQAQSGGRR